MGHKIMTKHFELDVKHGVCVEANLDDPIIGTLNSIAFRYKNLTMCNIKSNRKAIGFYFRDDNVKKFIEEIKSFLSSIRLTYQIYDESYENQIIVSETKKRK